MVTIAIILSAHGSVSGELLRTTEMIAGKQKNTVWVDLLPTENTDILIEKYNKYLLQLNINNGVLFLVDIWGGTPFNAAQRIIINKKNYDIITGINVPMLIEIFIARSRAHSIKELTQIALQSGLESIKSVKNLTHDHSKNNCNNNKEISTINKPVIDKIFDNNNKHNHKKSYMNICIARIDDRLIHGQVVTRWAKEYNIDRIIVINDDIDKDIIRKKLLTQVTPPGITAHVINIQKAIRVYHNPKYAKDKVIMLFTNPTDVLRLIQGGVSLQSINIGGMAFSHGKKQIHNVISVNKTDIEAFKELNKLGIDLEIRKVPSDSSLKLIKLIENVS